MLTLDAVDRGLIHALHLDGRVPFSRVAEIIGSSEQTVARRYQRLRAQAGLRVVGLPVPDRLGRTLWMLRLRTSPGATSGVARALARRAETSWVRLLSGGTEVAAMVTGPHPGESAPSLLLQDVPGIADAPGIDAHCVLHTYLGGYLGGPTAWPKRPTALDAEQIALLTPQQAEPDAEAEDVPHEYPLTAADRAIIGALRADGRASYARLAGATGLAQGTVARRLGELRAQRAVFFDVDVSPAVFGVTTQALIWLSVSPARLDDVAGALAGHPELAAVMATTGPTNLFALALCETPGDLHRYLTRGLSAVEGITGLETAPVLRTIDADEPA